MSKYVALENGRLENGAVRYELSKDGRIIMIHDPAVVGDHLREIMKPGDTYQERYTSSGRESKVFTFDEMVHGWQAAEMLLILAIWRLKMTKKIPLTRGKHTIVDDADYEWANQYKWYAQRSGDGFYAARRDYSGEKSKIVYMHRELTKAPRGKRVDHKNGNGLDNRRSNIRLVTNSQNLQNRGKNKNNTSGYKGVYQCKKTLRWCARIQVLGEYIWLGRHDTKIEAARAYDEAARKYFGEYAWLNLGEL